MSRIPPQKRRYLGDPIPILSDQLRHGLGTFLCYNPTAVFSSQNLGRYFQSACNVFQSRFDGFLGLALPLLSRLPAYFFGKFLIFQEPLVFDLIEFPVVALTDPVNLLWRTF